MTGTGAMKSCAHVWCAGVGASAALLALAVPAAAQDVPSGQPLTLAEVLIDTVSGEDWVRFRFVAPQIAREGGTTSYAAAQDDFAHLCDTVALDYLDTHTLPADAVVIGLMDRMVPFGQSDPEATQFIEVFRIGADGCEWEAL